MLSLLNPMPTKVIALCTLILLSVLGPASAAQVNVVRGVVTDEFGAAIAGTLVEIRCDREGVVSKTGRVHSGTDGSFQLEATLTGPCKIYFSAIGFKPLETSIRDSENRSLLDIGSIRLKVEGCSDPGVICDYFPATKRRRAKEHYTFVLPDRYVGWVQAIFNDINAQPLQKRKDGGYQIDVPESGIPRTSDSHVNDARTKNEFYYRVPLPEGGTALHPVPRDYVLPGTTNGGYTMMDTDGKGRGSSWYLFIGPPELRAKFPEANWDELVKAYAKTHGGKTRIESSGPYPTPGRMSNDAVK